MHTTQQQRLIGRLGLPDRSSKPRTAGLTMVIDSGTPTGWFCDAMASASPAIDVVKFGWGTSVVTPDLDIKITCLRRLGIPFFFGGTLFERFVVADAFDEYLEWCRGWGTSTVEISNGTIPLSNSAKADYVRRCTGEFTVLSEVGFKDERRAARLGASAWVEAIAEDLDAGATWVIAEARESGRSGICRADGTLRSDLVEDILSAGIDPARMVFEAPTKALQTWFVERLGADVNLGNIALGDVIGVETLRLGLRADTLFSATSAGSAGGKALPAPLVTAMRDVRRAG